MLLRRESPRVQQSEVGSHRCRAGSDLRTVSEDTPGQVIQGVAVDEFSNTNKTNPAT